MATDATDILIQRIRSQLSQGGVDASTLFQQTSTLLSTTANYAQILGTATGGIAQANAIALVGGSTAAAAEQAAFIAAGAATAGIGAGVALIVSFILAFLSGSNQSSESEQLAQLIEQLNVILQGVNNTTLTGYWQDKLHDIGSAWNSPQGALGDDLDYLSAEGTKGTHVIQGVGAFQLHGMSFVNMFIPKASLGTGSIYWERPFLPDQVFRTQPFPYIYSHTQGWYGEIAHVQLQPPNQSVTSVPE